jgi:acyl carrier protein
MKMQDEVRELVASVLQRRGDAAPFRDSDSLVLSRRLDSIDVLEIVTFLESRFGVDFSRVGINPNDLDTVDRIVALVGRDLCPCPA